MLTLPYQKSYQTHFLLYSRHLLCSGGQPNPKNYYHLPLSYIYSSVYIYTLRKGQTQEEKKEREKGENLEDTANQDRSHGVELSNDDESGKCIGKSLSIHSL